MYALFSQVPISYLIYGGCIVSIARQCELPGSLGKGVIA